MTTKQGAAVLVEQRHSRDRTEAYHDARALAIELARGEPTARFDPMTVGVVLQPRETIYRQVPLWIRVQQDGRWAVATYADVLVTDLRLLCRMGSGRLTSLWFNGVVGLHIDLAAEHVVLDYGDGQSVGLSWPLVAPVAVVGIASGYGTEAILTHYALAPLRTRGSSAPASELPDIRLPEIQRDYVWRSNQIAWLLDSLYGAYPSRSLLLWAPIQRALSSGNATVPAGILEEPGHT